MAAALTERKEQVGREKMRESESERVSEKERERERGRMSSGCLET